MSDLWSRAFGRIRRGRAAGGRGVRSGRVRTQRDRLHHESLEQRALLAITAVTTGGLSNGLVVATAPNDSLGAAEDVFITRSATGNLLVATDSSF
jgi:hypothetical protein